MRWQLAGRVQGRPTTVTWEDGTMHTSDPLDQFAWDILWTEAVDAWRAQGGSGLVVPLDDIPADDVASDPMWSYTLAWHLLEEPVHVSASADFPSLDPDTVT